MKKLFFDLGNVGKALLGGECCAFADNAGKRTVYLDVGIFFGAAGKQLTQQNAECAYTDKGIRFDEESGEYVVDTYVMRRETATDGIVGRVASLEDTRPVTPGEWIATNPTQQENDYPNNYVIPDTLFQKRYEATNQEGVYRNKGGARIIKNETGHSVIIEAPWGGPQEGDEHCYFCAACDDETETSISPDNRFILSENDFTTYVLASKAKD